MDTSRIITVPLYDDDYEELRDSKKLSAYIKQCVTDDGTWYVFLDEVHLCKGFEAVLNGLNRRENLDIYVTGSNSKGTYYTTTTPFKLGLEP